MEGGKKQKKKILGQQKNIKGLNNYIEEIENKNKGLEKYIEELENKNQQKDNLIHQQKKKIYNLEREVCELNVKAYRTDLRGMLCVFRKKVYIILFYSIFNTLILFLLLHVVGSDTVERK